MEFERILLAYDELSKKNTKLDYTKQDLLFTPMKSLGDIDVYTQFILDLKEYNINTDNIDIDTLIDYKEPVVEAVKKEEELSYPEVQANTVPETEKQVYDMSSVILAYNALNKITKLDYSINDILFDSDKEYNNLSIWADFILRLKEHDIIIDDFNPDDLIEIEPKVKIRELEGQTYPELKSNKELPDISLDKPHELLSIINAYNELDKKTTIGYARSDLLYNPEMEYGNLTIWQTFIINCHEHGIEL